MLKHRSLRLALLLVAIAAISAGAIAQQAQQKDSDIDSVLDSVRKDARTDKIAIITELIDLKGEESGRFWRVYREYEADLVKLNDRRIALLKDYAARFTTMSDSDARMLAEKSFEWETERTKLRKTYFEKFAKATSALTAAKYFQIERRLDLLLDLQIAAEVPGLFVKSSATSSQ